MTIIFEELFHAWCPPYHPDLIPDYLKADPVRAYGQYTFEIGFKLAMQLAAACLDPEELRKTDT